jgi:hypothetical protein
MQIKTISFDKTQFPPLLSLTIWGAPHYRQEMEVIQQYREKINEAAHKIGMKIPYDDILDLSIFFVNPTSPDLANLMMAFYQAVDGKALTGISLLTDDGLFQEWRKVSKYYPCESVKYENRIPR